MEDKLQFGKTTQEGDYLIVDYPDGTKIYYKNGCYSRDDGPAMTLKDGSKHWWKDGNYVKKDISEYAYYRAGDV